MKKLFIITWILFISYFAYFITMNVNAQTYRYGSRGDVVREIQTRLKRWGYYAGTVDGIYGYQTYLSVKRFQSKNGLIADGIVGPKTLAALGINVSSSSSSSGNGSQNLDLMTRIINGEARGEPYIGQVAVGGVVLNRVRDPRFPSTIPGVIYQPGAFTAVADGQINAAVLDSSKKAAVDALNGWDPSGGAIYYYNPEKTTNKWILSRPVIKVIGKHIFCK